MANSMRPLKRLATSAQGPHPFPFRTRQLSPAAPMVLQSRGCGRVGRRQPFLEARHRTCDAGLRCSAPCLIVDGAPIVHLDSTGADTIAALADELAARGVRLVFGGVLPQVRQMLERSGTLESLGADSVYRTLRAAVAACEAGLVPTNQADRGPPGCHEHPPRRGATHGHPGGAPRPAHGRNHRQRRRPGHFPGRPVPGIRSFPHHEAGWLGPGPGHLPLHRGRARRRNID